MTLTITNLTCARGGLAVLTGVSFGVSSGHALILQGANGIGKTTLLRTIAGLQPALSGQITAQQDGVAFAAHSDGIKASLTVSENLAFWAAIHGTKNIQPALAAMQLEPLAQRPAGTLSAGQKRRLGLARLMVANRSIWLLDEPTVSLDAASTALFVAMIGRHLGQGGAALIASHLALGLAQVSVFDLTPFAARHTAVSNAFDGVTA